MQLFFKSLIAILMLTLVPTLMSKDNISQIENKIQKSLNKFCIECHDAELDKGNVRFDNFSALSGEMKNKVLTQIEEQVYLEQMPPKDEDVLPSAAERKAWLGDIQTWFELHQTTSTFRDKVKKPEYGNYVDHEKLFSGEFKNLKGFTPDRQWVISEQIFREKVNGLINPLTLDIDGKKRRMRGHAIPKNIANPFTLGDKAGVRYYANEALSSSHFVSVLDNAPHIAQEMIASSRTTMPAVSKVTGLIRKHEEILLTRKVFLEKFIDVVCRDIYKEQNELLLPRYKPQALKDKIRTDTRGPNAFGRFPLSSPMGIGLAKFGNRKSDPMKLIRQCEKYWVHWGHDKESVERYLETLRMYVMTTIKKNAFNSHYYKYRALPPDEMKVISAAVKKHRQKGMPYKLIIDKCLYDWQSEFKGIRNSSNHITPTLVSEMINELFKKIYERSATKDETNKYSALFHQYVNELDERLATQRLIETLLLRAEFVVRNETGNGKADQYGRKMLSPRDASYAIAYALTDNSPDAELVKAVREGRLNTRKDYEREVKRLLNDRSHYYIIDSMLLQTGESLTNTPIRKLRFFKEFFGYDNALKVFKDATRFGIGMGSSRKRLITEADLLVDHILKKDKNVFEELLTTEKFYVYHNSYNENVAAVSNQIKNAYDYFTKNNWRSFKSFDDLMKHKKFLDKHGFPGKPQKKKNWFGDFVKLMTSYEERLKGKKYFIPFNRVRFTESFPVKSKLPYRMEVNTGSGGGNLFHVSLYFNIDPWKWDYPPEQPAKIVNRMGMLTHPAWLQAFSQNTHTDPVTRGKWIREKLLAGTIPDVPIGVEAVIPENHEKTLRQRLKDVTGKKECWRCHKYMNPLGNAFEMYDDFGRYRTEEDLEHEKSLIKIIKHSKSFSTFVYKKAPVDTTGVLNGTGDKNLDGAVKDAHDMIQRLVKSPRVRQSIIRHAFRYFMGRNEALSDSKTLIDADEAYVKSGGSFDAVIISLLTSDSFIYRKELKE